MKYNLSKDYHCLVDKTANQQQMELLRGGCKTNERLLQCAVARSERLKEPTT